MEPYNIFIRPKINPFLQYYILSVVVNMMEYALLVIVFAVDKSMLSPACGSVAGKNCFVFCGQSDRSDVEQLSYAMIF